MNVITGTSGKSSTMGFFRRDEWAMVIHPGPWEFTISCIYGGVPARHGGTPVHHPFLDGIFPELNHPAMVRGTPMTMETPI